MRRYRISLRLMLLVVALFAVFFAWLGARRDLHRTNLRGQIRGLEIMRDYAAGRTDDPIEGEHWRKALIENETMISEKRRQLGETDR